MTSHIHIFVLVVCSYVFVINFLMIRTFYRRHSAIKNSQVPTAHLPKNILMFESKKNDNTRKCLDETIYVAFVMYNGQYAKDNSRRVSQMTKDFVSGMRKLRDEKVHILLIGSADSSTFMHRQWCRGIIPPHKCSILTLSDLGTSFIFKRVLKDYICIQDMVLISGWVYMSYDFFERLSLIPRNEVTCLSRDNNICHVHRICHRYMLLHQAAHNISEGAASVGLFNGYKEIFRKWL